MMLMVEKSLLKSYAETFTEDFLMIMRICRSKNANKERAAAIQKLIAPNGYYGYYINETYITFHSLANGIDFDLGNKRIRMTYKAFVKELLKLYNPFSIEFVQKQRICL